MKNINNIKMLVLLVAALSLTSCFKDNTEDCRYTIPSYLVVRATAANLSSPDQRLVDEAIMFIFDHNTETFIARRDISAEEIINNTHISLNFPDRDSVLVVVWGNTAPVNQVLIEPQVGAHIDMLRLELGMLSESSAYEPTDIFHGIRVVAANCPIEEGAGYLVGDTRAIGSMRSAGSMSSGTVGTRQDVSQWVEIQRKVSVIKIVIQKNDLWDNNNYDPSRFKIEVQNVCAGMDFRGNPVFESVTTITTLGMHDNGTNLSTNVVVLPSDNNCKIVITDQDGNKVTEIEEDKNGDNLVVDQPDKEVDVEITQKEGEFEVTITIDDWNYNEQDTDTGWTPEELA